MRRISIGLQNRRGFTLILTGFMFTVLIGAAAFAVDFGRMYMYRAQLQSAADAAALAGAQRIMVRVPTECSASAIDYASRNSVGGVSVTLAAADVIDGHWERNPPAGIWTLPFTPNGDCTNPPTTSNAVRVTTRYTGTYGFGRLLGFTSKSLTATADAVVAYVGTTACVRPVALPYRKVLEQLYGTATTLDPATYDLTETDITNLANANISAEVLLRVTDVSGSPSSGNFYGVSLGPFQYADGTLGSPSTGMGNYASNFGGTCSASTYQGNIGAGDWLQAQNGAGAGPVESGFETLCGVSVRGVGETSCPAPKEIKVAMWAPHGSEPSGCTPSCFWVKYVGVFVVTKYTKSPASPSAPPDGISGYFKSMPTTGGITMTPSPLKTLALVK